MLNGSCQKWLGFGGLEFDLELSNGKTSNQSVLSQDTLTPVLFFKFFAEICMKMKEFWTPGGADGALLDPPMHTDRQADIWIDSLNFSINEKSKRLLTGKANEQKGQTSSDFLDRVGTNI